MLSPLGIDQNGLDVKNFLGHVLLGASVVDHLLVSVLPVESLNAARLDNLGQNGEFLLLINPLLLLLLFF